MASSPHEAPVFRVVRQVRIVPSLSEEYEVEVVADRGDAEFEYFRLSPSAARELRDKLGSLGTSIAAHRRRAKAVRRE